MQVNSEKIFEILVIPNYSLNILLLFNFLFRIRYLYFEMEQDYTGLVTTEHNSIVTDPYRCKPNIFS